MPGGRGQFAAGRIAQIGQASAAGDVDFLCLLIRRHRDAIRCEAMAEYVLARAKARAFWSATARGHGGAEGGVKIEIKIN